MPELRNFAPVGSFDVLDCRAVEADWPDAARVDAYVRHLATRSTRNEALRASRNGVAQRGVRILSGCAEAMDDNFLLDGFTDTTAVEIGSNRLLALLGLGEKPKALVIFAHGSGSGRLSPRNNYVAERLRRVGLATLLLDLLTQEEERDRRNVFDVRLLAERLALAHDWAADDPRTRELPFGYFGASTGAAAALIAAALPESRAGAVVSRGGRPDLAAATLANVRAPTLLIVGSLDVGVIELNETALARLTAPKELVIVPGAGHLFEEPGALDAVVEHAVRWFTANLVETTAVAGLA